MSSQLMKATKEIYSICFAFVDYSREDLEGGKRRKKAARICRTGWNAYVAGFSTDRSLLSAG